MSFGKKLRLKQFLWRTNDSDVYWKNKAFKLIYNAGPTFGSQASKQKTKCGRNSNFHYKSYELAKFRKNQTLIW